MKEKSHWLGNGLFFGDPMTSVTRDLFLSQSNESINRMSQLINLRETQNSPGKNESSRPGKIKKWGESKSLDMLTSSLPRSQWGKE
jgi:hypothetical protein